MGKWDHLRGKTTVVPVPKKIVTPENSTIDELHSEWDRTAAALVAHPEMQHWKIKGYKQRQTRDGVSWGCKLLYKGAPAGDAENLGDGGPDRYFLTNDDSRASFAILEAFVVERTGSHIEPFARVLDAMLLKGGK